MSDADTTIVDLRRLIEAFVHARNYKRSAIPRILRLPLPSKQRS